MAYKLWPFRKPAPDHREAEINHYKRTAAAAVQTAVFEGDVTEAQAENLNRLLDELMQRKRGYNG